MSDLREGAKQALGSKNCMQCAVAYMLGLPLADVPDFEKAGAGAWESFEAFFSERGFTAELFPPSVEILGDYLASGDTGRGTSHMVVMRGGELLHDPHPSSAGLTSIQAVWLIVRRAGPQPTHPAPQRQQQDEPVAWINAARDVLTSHPESWGRECEEWTPLYTHPAPQRQPLTTEQIAALESRRHRNLPPDFDYTEGAWFELGIRHGERAHYIGVGGHQDDTGGA